MRTTRSMRALPEPFTKISLYNDTSAVISQAHRAFAPLTLKLMKQRIMYKWGFPTKLLVTYQCQQISILIHKDGIKQLHNWGIIPDPPPSPSPQACYYQGIIYPGHFYT